MDQILIDNILQIAGSFIVGIIIGIISENLWLKHSLKIEKIKRLAPQLEVCCPIVERILEDSGYGLKILKRSKKGDKDLDGQNKRILEGLSMFQVWHMEFQEKGLKYELESVNSELMDRLSGLFTIAHLSEKHGITYVSQNLKQIHENALISNEKLKLVLKS